MNKVIETLREIIAALAKANEGAYIIDTIWMQQGNETVFDALERVKNDMQLLAAVEAGSETELRKEIYALRELLCLKSASLTHLPYMDDGELQDNSCFPHIDYKRDSVGAIKAKLTTRTLRELEALRRDIVSVPQEFFFVKELDDDERTKTGV